MNKDRTPPSPIEAHPASTAANDIGNQTNFTFVGVPSDKSAQHGVKSVGVSTNLVPAAHCSGALPQRPTDSALKRFRLWDAVIEAGFAVSPNRFGAELKYRGVELSATESLNRHFCPVVSVCGFYVSGARMAQINEELPQEVDSRDLALAYLAWALEPLAEILLKEGGSLPAWWSEGRLLGALLPWEQEKARWAAMPSCRVDYAWARVALRTLGEMLRGIDPLSEVKFEFDGEILRIRCAGGVVAAVAQGKAWPEAVTVSVTDIWKLPTRLSRNGVEISVRDDALIIHRHGYRLRSPKTAD